ncbi:MAG: A/G-specific adenine glycosylase [Caldilineaceae bacterium]
MNYSAISTLLARWHETYQRDLPWRMSRAGERDPYQVWISEIMLQQTRVETVIDYFQRWMAKFPTVEALAAADQQEVLKAWEGLGYYARARNLHKAAQQVVAHYQGKLPQERAWLLQLAGIGEYTVGAILSLAFGQAEPILDGNVKRVFSRLADIDRPIEESATLKQLWQMANELVQAAAPGEAGIVNEALMELGALICTPQSPRCLLCPLIEHCQAAAHGTQAERPVTLPKKRTPHYDVAAGVIWQAEPYNSRFLIAQRPQKGLLGGLWEFPGGKLEPTDADLPACLRREINEELAIEIEVREQFTTVHHAYTHFRVTLHTFHARHLQGEPQKIGVADWRWVTLEELDSFPFPVTDLKIIKALKSGKVAELKS